MTSKAANAEAYLAELPEDRREAISTIREGLKKSLPEGYVETMQYGMITFVVPHTLYPPGYHCDPKQALPFVSIASQKNHMSVYMMCFWDASERERFIENYVATGKKLDLGRGCLRFKKLENLALDLVLQTVAAIPVEQFVANYVKMLPPAKRKVKA